MNAFNPTIHVEAAAVILITALLSSKFKLLDKVLHSDASLLFNLGDGDKT